MRLSYEVLKGSVVGFENRNSNPREGVLEPGAIGKGQQAGVAVEEHQHGAFLIGASEKVELYDPTRPVPWLDVLGRQEPVAKMTVTTHNFTMTIPRKNSQGHMGRACFVAPKSRFQHEN
jgi:hypothetical protein